MTFHVEAPEAEGVKRESLQRIRDEGRLAGLAISPGTPVSSLMPYTDRLDIAMVMTVVPGAGGQRFLPDEAHKIADARPAVASAPLGEIHVDGGVNRDTASAVGAFGADVLVVGSALFQRGRDTAAEVDLVRRAAWAAARGDDAAHGDAATLTAPLR